MLTLIDFLKMILNTLVRLSPIGLYMGTAISGLVFNDFRAVLLFVGFVINEFIALGYRLVFKGVANPNCALLYSSNVDVSTGGEARDVFVLPSSITQTIGFFVGFVLADMYNNDQFSPTKFAVSMILIILTVYSRINVGCESLIDSIYLAVQGSVIGILYFAIIKDYYRPDFFNKEITTVTDDFFKLD